MKKRRAAIAAAALAVGGLLIGGIIATAGPASAATCPGAASKLVSAPGGFPIIVLENGTLSSQTATRCNYVNGKEMITHFAAETYWSGRLLPFSTNRP